MSRKLHGVVSSVDDKIIIIGGHIPSLEKLRDINDQLTANFNPISYNNVSINYGTVPVDNLIGKKVTVWVRIKKYNFKSTFTHNLGEVVFGWYLQLIKVEESEW